MTGAERLLVGLLWLHAAVLALALPAALLPTDGMEAIHQALGLGPLPRAPLVEYLTRSLSALYAAFAPVYALAAGDVRRYRPLIVVLAVVHTLLGAFLLGLDLWAGLPAVWTLSEGPVVLALGGLLLLLVRRLPG